MPSRKIIIVGTDPDQCAKLKAALQAHTSDPIVVVTSPTADAVPPLTESDVVILAGEEPELAAIWRDLLKRQRQRQNRSAVLTELIRLSMSAGLEDMLQAIVAKSTEVVGDTALIALESKSGYDLNAVFSSDADRLNRMLMAGINISLRAIAHELLRNALDKGKPVLIPDLAAVSLAPELQPFVDKHELRSLIVAPVRGKDHALGGFVILSTAPATLTDDDLASAMELSDLAAMVIENARMATTDAVTGLYNRGFFDAFVARETARSERHASALSLMMIDVDGFKRINDELGHPVADKVLARIARLLDASVRSTDLVFRYGGDEFSVILPNTNASGALRVAEKILERARSADILHPMGLSGAATVSIGISEYTRGNSAEMLVNEADEALREAKRAGKNTVRVFKKGRGASPG